MGVHGREACVVGHEKAGVDGKHVFRRQRVSDDQELSKLSVDHRREVVAGLEPVSVRERFVDQHFVVAPRPQVAPGPQDQSVEGRFASRGDGDEVSPSRGDEIVHR
jgi:hypothetical protein